MGNILRDKIIELIKNNALDEARHELVKWMAIEEDRAEIHHLFGVICEICHEKDRAKKHYRAAYAMDPSYQYAMFNLERLVTSQEIQRDHHLYYGDEDLND